MVLSVVAPLITVGMGIQKEIKMMVRVSWEGKCVVMLSSEKPSCPQLSVAYHAFFFDRILFYIVVQD